ncbi:MAG TPA: hypothetical protein VJ780_12310 [Flavobacterium sp.]|nr:hypothetical protein [Flavobacterium sp.]
MEKETKEYTPNHITPDERAKCFLYAFILIIYGTFGYLADDIYLPAKHGRGSHFHGLSCLIMYVAFIFGAINCISIIVDHYDKRNNEINYQRFANVTRIIGVTCFISALIISLFQN